MLPVLLRLPASPLGVLPSKLGRVSMLERWNLSNTHHFPSQFKVSLQIPVGAGTPYGVEALTVPN